MASTWTSLYASVFATDGRDQHVAGVAYAVGRDRGPARGTSPERRIQSGDLTSQIIFEGAVTDNQERSRAPCHRIDEHAKPFVVDESPDEEHTRRRSTGANLVDAHMAHGIHRMKARQINADWDDRHSARMSHEGGLRGGGGTGCYDAIGATVKGPLHVAIGMRRPPGTNQIAVVPDDEPRRSKSKKQLTQPPGSAREGR